MKLCLKVLLLLVILLNISCTEEYEYNPLHLLLSDGNKIYYIDGKSNYNGYINFNKYFDLRDSTIYYSSDGKIWKEVTGQLLDMYLRGNQNKSEYEKQAKAIGLTKKELDFLFSKIDLLENEYHNPRTIVKYNRKQNKYYRIIVGKQVQRSFNESDTDFFFDIIKKYLLNSEHSNKWESLWIQPVRRSKFYRLFPPYYEYYPQDIIFTPDEEQLIVTMGSFYYKGSPFHRFLVFDKDGNYQECSLYSKDTEKLVEEYILKPIKKSSVLPPDYTDEINTIYWVFNKSQKIKIISIGLLIFILFSCFKFALIIYNYIKNKTSITKKIAFIFIGSTMVGFLFFILFEDIWSLIRDYRYIIKHIKISGFKYVKHFIFNSISTIILCLSIIYFIFKYKVKFIIELFFLIGLILFPFVGFNLWAMGIIPW